MDFSIGQEIEEEFRTLRGPRDCWMFRRRGGGVVRANYGDAGDTAQVMKINFRALPRALSTMNLPCFKRLNSWGIRFPRPVTSKTTSAILSFGRLFDHGGDIFFGRSRG